MFILDNFDGFETTKEWCCNLITDMYVVRGLTYITLEKEDKTLKSPNLLKIFSLTRGLDLLSPELLDELVTWKYGTKLRFFGEKDDLNTILAFQSNGIWKTGVQFFQSYWKRNIIDEKIIASAIEFTDNFALAISAVTFHDLWLFKNLKAPDNQTLIGTLTNLQSRYFEICVQEFLRTKHRYSEILTRHTMPYLKGKEIDVYAKREVLGTSKQITLCECKLKFSNNQVKPDEVSTFIEIVTKVREHEKRIAEQEGINIKIIAYLVTNSSFFPETAKLLNSQGIECMIAKLPANWFKRCDWKIVNMKSCAEVKSSKLA
jgi:hypothetical protein